MTTTSITVEPVLLSQAWKKNDTNFYRIRFTLQRQSRYIKTNIVVRREQIGRGGKIRDSELRNKLQSLVQELEEVVSRIDTYALARMTVDDAVSFVEKYMKKDFRLDIFTFGYEVATEKGKSSRGVYNSALQALKAFAGRETMDIAEVTSSLLRRWEEWLRKEYGDGARAVSSYTAALRHIHNQARARYNDEELGYTPIRNPYQYYSPPVQRSAPHRAVEASLLDKMLEMRETLEGRERIGVDVFLLSFALMGMNSPDIYSCAAPKRGVITYNRTKTRHRRQDGALMKVKIDPLVAGLIQEYSSPDKERAFIFDKSYSCWENLGRTVNIGLRRFCQRIGYTGHLTLYNARHTWASVAYSAHIDKGVINDCLCHVDKSMKVTDIYISRDWSVLWDANHKVLEQFRWP